MPNDTRLIEDYIPIEDISAEARREKSIRKGHISTLHLWWARRPLVAARAAVYGALVPAPKDKKARKEADAFVKRLCKYPGSPETIKQAPPCAN
jgi:putative DNA methylase